MRFAVRFLPEAEAELSEAAAFYEGRREGLGVELIESVDRTIEEIRDNPEAAPFFRSGRPFRKRTMRRFPFVVVYKVMIDTVEITAIAHTSRRPGYWLGR